MTVKKEKPIPKQYYVTFQRGELIDWKDPNGGRHPPLGYIGEYKEFNAACEKRMENQRQWAGYEKIEEHGGVYFKTKSAWVWNNKTNQKEQRFSTEPLDKELIPQIINNVPLDGFRILTTVTRSSTSNKLWRVVDPRGFQLEISTESFERIILSAVVSKGLIIGPCIWKSNKDLLFVGRV